jgi:alpha-tubulin suppressor-like RCC1 family protein
MRIKKIIFKYDSGFLIDESNNVYASGSNEHGQLGLSAKEHYFIKDPIKLMEKFDEIKIGREFTYALKKNGYFNKWYCTGYDGYFQLAIGGNEYESIQKWTYSDIKDIFVTIECGYNHCLALTSENELYCWGDNQYFQLTKFEEKMVRSPKKTKYKFKQIFAFADSNFAFNESDELFFWGSNKNGVSGVNHLSEDYNIRGPLHIYYGSKILDLSFSDTHVVIKYVNGGFGLNYWQYGSNKNGQLLDLTNSSMDVMTVGNGEGKFEEDNKTMKRIIFPSVIGTDKENKIKKIWCGNDVTIYQNEDDYFYLIADKYDNIPDHNKSMFPCRDRNNDDKIHLEKSLFIKDFILHDYIYFAILINNDIYYYDDEEHLKLINEKDENLFKNNLWIQLKKELNINLYFQFDMEL